MIEKQFKLKHYVALVLIFIVILLSSIHPLEFEAYLLHQVGTVFMLVLLFIIFKKIGLDFLSFTLYLLFLLIHIIGAHYLYSYVPYNDWIQQVFHFNLDQYMGWSRNMYDRLVHLAYGVLLYPLIYRVFEVWLPTARPFTLFLLVIQFVMASSVFYELIEWAIAIGLSPEEAENYNGQQGDMWDAHKDMLLATIGAIIYGLAALIKAPKINNS
ncbi:Inner membrane protein YjdF [Acinetobacter calcoaceticus]|nr:Inner membrane protein YjdF [Acinetobacter calcoaceticus]